jgi:hypothetical protein
MDFRDLTLRYCLKVLRRSIVDMQVFGGKSGTLGEEFLIGRPSDSTDNLSRLRRITGAHPAILPFQQASLLNI